MKKHELKIYTVDELEEPSISLVFTYESKNMKDIRKTLKDKIKEFTITDDIEYIINTYKSNDIVKVIADTCLQKD